MRTIHLPAERAQVARRFKTPVSILRIIVLLRNHVRSNAELFSLFIGLVGALFLKQSPAIGLVIILCAVGMSVNYRNRKGGNHEISND
jgi:hypothetical protein